VFGRLFRLLFVIAIARCYACLAELRRTFLKSKGIVVVVLAVVVVVSAQSVLVVQDDEKSDEKEKKINLRG
jgi:hypothetical protein